MDSGLPLSYWPEAVDCANYTRNRIVLTGYMSKSPAELWFNKPVSLQNLRTFGAVCYRKPVNNKLGKLTSNGDLSCFLGYANTDGDYYWVLSISNGRIYKTRDVIFNEAQLYKDLNSDLFNTPPQGVVYPLFSDHPSPSNVPPHQTNDQTTIPRPIRVSPRPGITKSYAHQFNSAAFSISEPPQTFKQAVTGLDSDIWEQSMDSELMSLRKNRTFQVCNLPPGRKTVASRWVYDIKGDGRFKSRVVAKGFTQVEGIDYQETFSPTLKMSTFRLLLSQSVRLGLTLTHMDVVTAFLNGSLDEEIYMQPPPTVKNIFPKGKVLKLKKALYGLKQSSRQWNLRFYTFMLALGYLQSDVDPWLYQFVGGPNITFVAVYAMTYS